MATLSGQWRGTIVGTNSGEVLLDLVDEAGAITGVIEVRDERFGLSTFEASGYRDEELFTLRLTPRDTQPDTVITPGAVQGRIDGENKILGAWETELGTAGKFAAKRLTPTPPLKSHNNSMPEPSTKRPALTPLWVISLFLSMTEVVTGIAVTQATGGVQAALTVFVIIFPLLVGSAFFAVLWNRPYVFYPPTEFGGGTNVAEYVRALGGAAPIDSGAKQQWLFGKSKEATATHTETAGATESVPTAKSASDPELAQVVFKYFGFQQMRYTDVSNGESRALFNLGVDYRFNLFDGLVGITFFGYFPEIEVPEIVARVRFLLNNIQTTYVRLGRIQDNSAQQQTALQILDQLSIVVLISEESDIDVIQKKIEEFRPSDSKVPVKIVRPGEVREFVRTEYEKMGLGGTSV